MILSIKGLKDIKSKIEDNHKFLNNNNGYSVEYKEYNSFIDDLTDLIDSHERLQVLTEEVITVYVPKKLTEKLYDYMYYMV